jgi:hypothetical protein
MVPTVIIESPLISEEGGSNGTDITHKSPGKENEKAPLWAQ